MKDLSLGFLKSFIGKQITAIFQKNNHNGKGQFLPLKTKHGYSHF